MPAVPRLLVALYGPTSAGKTKLSVGLCVRIRDELKLEPMIVVADCRQVYQHLDLGTGKPTAEEMGGITHTMLDVAEPVRRLELETFATGARQHINACWEAGGVPVVVGGSSAYIRALLEGWHVDAKADDDPELAVTWVPTRRVVLGMDRDGPELDRRIATRYDEQVGRGLRDEILGLDERYDVLAQYRESGEKFANQIVHLNGYREWFDVALERDKAVADLDESDLGEIRDRVVEGLRNRSRRQRAAIPKLRGIKLVHGVADAFAEVKLALDGPGGAGARPGNSNRSGPKRSAGFGSGRFRAARDKRTGGGSGGGGRKPKPKPKPNRGSRGR